MPIALSLVIILAAAPQVPEDRPRGFTVRPVTTAPRIAGAPEVTGRTTVLTQADSPLRVVAVDLTEATFGDAAGGVIHFEVGNASDRTVQGGALDLRWRTAGYVTMSGVAGTAAADVLLVAMVDRVNFGWCRYHPARSYPKAGPR